MKTNWTKTVNEINRKRYTIPEGWETKEQVAESLQCAPDRVAELLKPGIAGGEVERQEFSVWDEKRRLASRVTCYRVATGEKKVPDSKEERIRAAILRYPDLSDNAVSRKLNRVSTAEVRAARANLG